MAEKRFGRQTPTANLYLPFEESKGDEAIELYELSGRKAIEWQKLLIGEIMGQDEDGLWVHQKFGYSVPRRNGKNEIVSIREMWGLENGEHICHTAHRVSTAHSAWQRLIKILNDAGYEEVPRKVKGMEIPEKSFYCTKALGLETVELASGGSAVFRTRSANGGLGEGFDLLVIDEAQEYTTAQQSALIYTVSDSKNPQTLLCGTPPTTESHGDVFVELRKSCIVDHTSYDTGWAEWGVDREPRDLMDVDAWYETNPSMGYHLNERKVRSEYDPRNDLDFIIQRLGFWYSYSLKSAITEAEWRMSEVDKCPPLADERYFGIKFGKDGANTCLSVASKLKDSEKVFVEVVDVKPIKDGVDWIIPYLQNPHFCSVAVDGEAGIDILQRAAKEAKIGAKRIKTPVVSNIVAANARFEDAVFNNGLCHVDQAPLRETVSNCAHRLIGSKGGFGYQSNLETYDPILVEATALAYWLCTEAKKKVKQNVVF